MIRFLLVQNRQGKTRFGRWYVNYEDKEKHKLCTQIHRLLINRGSKFTNFIEFRNYKIVYRRFVGLYFIFCIDLNDSELMHLEFTQ